eukprot:11201246-Karenia_brevis.AAC.1
MLYSRKDGHVACASTCCKISANALRAFLGSLLKSAEDHKSMPTAVAVAKSTFSSSMGSPRA